jgi:hypothetical protein
MPLIELNIPEGAESFDALVAIFLAAIGDQQQIIAIIPLPSIGNLNSYLDITWDYAEASFVAECLGGHCQERCIDMARRDHRSVLHLTLGNYIKESLALELARMALAVNSSGDDGVAEWDESLIVREQIRDHEEQLASVDLLFPELADSYLVNLIHGAYYEWEGDAVEAELKAHPERRYGFFVSRTVCIDGSAALCSIDDWIIPGEIGLEGLSLQLGIPQEELLSGEALTTVDKTIFLADHAVIHVLASRFLNALACGDDYMRRNHRRDGIHGLLTFCGTPSHTCSNSEKRSSAVLVGEFGTRVLLRCKGFSILFTGLSPMTPKERLSHAESLFELEVSMRDGEPPSSHISIPWSTIDDERFEQLCFDYLFAHPDFDKDRIEKIGKSRSRDGGRDIVAWTHPRWHPYRPAEKFIFQCKHIGAEASLTPKHLQAIGDTIEQYGAHGYGIMCSGYIDATLHDRVDAIANQRQLAPTRKLDRFHLERFLARRPHLVRRYFNDET